MRNRFSYDDDADESEKYDRDGLFSDVDRFNRNEELSIEQEEAFLAMTEEDDALLAMLDEDAEPVPEEIED